MVNVDHETPSIALTVARLERALTESRHWRRDPDQLAARIDSGIEELRAAEATGWTIPLLRWLERARPSLFGLAMALTLSALSVIAYRGETVAVVERERARATAVGPTVVPVTSTTSTTRPPRASDPEDQRPASAGPRGDAGASTSTSATPETPETPEAAASTTVDAAVDAEGGRPPVASGADDGGPAPVVSTVTVGDGVEVPSVTTPEADVGPVDVPSVFHAAGRGTADGTADGTAGGDYAAGRAAGGVRGGVRLRRLLTESVQRPQEDRPGALA